MKMRCIIIIALILLAVSIYLNLSEHNFYFLKLDNYYYLTTKDYDLTIDNLNNSNQEYYANYLLRNFGNNSITLANYKEYVIHNPLLPIYHFKSNYFKELDAIDLIYKNKRRGLITIINEDVDNDNQKELLILSLHNKYDGSDATIELKIVDWDGEKIITTYDNDIGYINFGTIYSFPIFGVYFSIREVQEHKYIYVERNYKCNYASDVNRREITKYEYNGKILEKICEYKLQYDGQPDNRDYDKLDSDLELTKNNAVIDCRKNHYEYSNEPFSYIEKVGLKLVFKIERICTYDNCERSNYVMSFVTFN